jgi:hypothetical protein
MSKNIENEAISKDLLEKIIFRKYRTFMELAEELDIHHSTLHKNLKNPTTKFLARLEKEAGLDLSTFIKNDNSINQNIEKSDMVVAQSGKSRGSATENNHFACAYNSDAIKDAVNNAVAGYEKSIILLEKWNGDLKEEIKTLREEVERLKRKK